MAVYGRDSAGEGKGNVIGNRDGMTAGSSGQSGLSATGPIVPPDPAERGFKDTVKVNTGCFTIIRAKFDCPRV